MHKLTKITPFIRKEVWLKYSQKMRKTKWKWKELFYVELSTFYRVHYNTIRKIIKRAIKWDFTVHLSTTKDNLGHNFNNYTKKAKTLSAFIKRAYKWFKNKWITIKKLMSDNGLEFTTHHELPLEGINYQDLSIALKWC
jgi:hypothetical protein